MKKTHVLFSVLAILFSGHSFANDTLLTEARQISQQLPSKLKSVLQQEIAEKGHAAAISVCRDQAPIIAKQIATDSGWKIKRVSLLTRNEQRATPDSWERQMLEEFDAKVAAGSDPATLEASTIMNNEYRYLKALPVQAQCLSCHGKSEVSEEVQTALKTTYPNDHATGYSIGQVRGAISLRKTLAIEN